MGCWAGTCNISHLPISYNDKVRAVLIQGRPYALEGVIKPKDWVPVESPIYKGEGSNKDPEYKAQREAADKSDRWRSGWWSGYTYDNDVFMPRTLPFKGTYDDYGGVDVSDKSIIPRMIMKQFKRDLLEYPAGLYSIPDKISKRMSLKRMISAIERDSVTVADDYKGEPAPVGLWMVREDIYQSIITMDIPHPWRKDERYNLETMRAQKDSFVSYLKAFNYPENNYIFRGLETLADGPLGAAFDRHSRGIGSFTRLLVDEMKEGLDPEGPQVDEFFERICEFGMLRIAMSFGRIGWMPVPGKGSQDIDSTVHARIAEAVLEAHKNYLHEMQELEEIEDE
jgi:hypothetical protein